MSRHATGSQGSPPSRPLPADHVLKSGAVVFPGAFDQHGCPLVIFPADAHGNLTSALSKDDVVYFINHFLCLNNQKQEASQVAVVADLRQASLSATRFIAETLLLLERHRRTVHTVYVVQPYKKDVLKLLLKLLMPSKSYVAPFKRVLLKEVVELSNYIDRSQLTPSLGGYLVYCHHSWVSFVKEIDAFSQEFFSVVRRLPSCISTLQSLARQTVPSGYDDLRDFCSTNEAMFQQLRRELGLDKLLRKCECVVQKLRYPENEPCYQAMAGTALFTHTAFEMLQNYSRITAAVAKMELLWQQAFSKAHLQLQVCQLCAEAQQITEQINRLQKEKLQPYRIEIAKDSRKAAMLTSQFEASIYTPAMALVRRSEDVIHTLAEALPSGDARTREDWVLDLDRLKEGFHSAVELPYRTLRAVCDFHHYYNKSKSWYNVVLCENLLQDLLWGVNGESAPEPCQSPVRHTNGVPAWRQSVCDFLRRNPSPDVEELIQLTHLAKIIPDAELQRAGQQLSQRCMTLSKLLTASGVVSINDLQLALHWQYDFLRASHMHGSHSDLALGEGAGAFQNRPGVPCGALGNPSSRLDHHTHSYSSLSNLTKWTTGKMTPHHHQPPLGVSPPAAVSGAVSAAGKPPSLSSFDSGFDGAGSSHLEVGGGGREGWEVLSRVAGTRDSFRPVTRQLQIHEENISSVSDSEERREESDFGSVGSNASRACIEIIPKVTVDSLNFEIKVTRSATSPQNPWLSLPVEDLENSYTVTVTHHPPAHRRDRTSPDSSEHSHHTDQSSRSRDQPTQTETPTRRTQSGTSLLHTQSFEDPELSPIRNILSSTITEARDKFSCTTESVPTLLWDSYDFHNLKQDTCEGMTSSMSEVSLNDWALKEQEGLNDIEEILDRAAGILEEEEHVLAQEEMLDVLLEAEGASKPWALWGSADQRRVMSSSDLVEAGVLGLEDPPASVDSENLCEFPTLEAVSEPSDDGTCCDRGLTASEATASSSSREQGLRDLRVLEELIVEEKLKIHTMRLSEKECLDEKPPESTFPRSTSKERQMFLFELEREKREVEIMERNFAKEKAKECKLKKCSSRTRKVVKCSVMERTLKLRNMEDSALCDELISQSRSQRHNMEHLATTGQNDGNLDINTSCNTHAISFPDSITEKAISQERVRTVNTPSSPGTNTDGIYESLDHSDLAVPSAPQPVRTPPESAYTSKESTKEMGSQPQENKLTSGSMEVDESSTPEASLTPERSPEHGLFDPGGNSDIPPVPKPRKTQLSVNETGPQVNRSTEPMTTPTNDLDTGPIVQTLSTTPKPKERKTKPSIKCHSPILSTDVDRHTNNNNNNTAITDQQAVHVDACNKPESNACAPRDDSLVDSWDPETSPTTHSCSNVDDLAPELLSNYCEPSGVDGQSADGHYGVARRSISRSPVNQLQQPPIHTNPRQMTNFKTPIVLDTGSGLMKAGFADQDLPTTIFPTIIGLPKYEEIMNCNFEREAYIGHEAQHMRGVLALKYPMKNGIIRNWDEMEKIWHHTFQQLRVEPEDHPVLLTEAAMNPRENRQRMVELMFECFNVPFTYVAMQAVLALFSAGRSTGVVFDSGDGVSHSVPVFEGYSLPHAVQRYTLAGCDVTMHLKKLLQEQGVCMRTSAEMEIVREIKEKCCCVAQDYELELKCGGSSSREMCYTMPDGQVICLRTERFRAPEILFKPELIGRDHYGMHESIFKSILSSDIELRRSFLGNIVLSGGNTLLAGLPERLQKEIRDMVPTDLGECVRVTSPKDRDFSVWSGGAVLANLPSFASAWISQEEYEEFGPQIVFRKCF